MAVGVASALAIGTRFPGGVGRSDKYHKPKRADRSVAFMGHSHRLSEKWYSLLDGCGPEIACADLRPSRRALRLHADAPPPSHPGGGDDRVSGTDAERHDDIYRNDSSRFGGNADRAEMADLAVSTTNT